MIRLQELREEHHLNKKEAAAFLHKKYTTYVNHEKGEREPDSEDLKAYATAYNVSIDYLVGLTNEKHPAPKESEMDEYDVQLSALFKYLSIDQKKFLLAQIQTLVANQGETR